MLRKCSKCGKLLPESKFNWKIYKIRRQYHCQECSRAYIREHYKRNKKYYKDKAKKRTNLLLKEGHKIIAKYLLFHPCVDCGEKNILLLEFDHRDRSVKDNDVSRIIKSRGSIEKLIEEIQKCDIRCANCHRRKTEIENKSWKLKYAPVA